MSHRQESKRCSAALKGPLGLKSLYLVRWPRPAAEAAGDVGTRLFQLPQCLLDLPASSLHRLSPLPVTLPWLMGPEKSVALAPFCPLPTQVKVCCAGVEREVQREETLHRGPQAAGARPRLEPLPAFFVASHSPGEGSQG